MKNLLKAVLLASLTTRNAFFRPVGQRFILPIAKRAFCEQNTISRIDLPKAGGFSSYIASRADLNWAGTEALHDVVIEDEDVTANCNSVAGYVPFVQGQTKIVFYNYFSKNYGIRRQLLVRFALCKSTSVVAVKWSLISADSVCTIDFPEWNEKSGDYIAIEAFNPRLPKNHAGNDGHLRCWGLYNDGAATVHSMPMANLTTKPKSTLAVRRFIPKPVKSNATIDASFISLHGKTIVGDANPGCYKNSRIAPVGYIALSESAAPKATRAVWHEADLPDFNLREAFAAQAIALPPIAGLDIILEFSEALSVEEDIQLSIFNLKNRLIQSRKVRIGPEDHLQLSEVFTNCLTNNESNGASFAVVEFGTTGSTSISGYVNFAYVTNDKICDSVHAHSALEDGGPAAKNRKQCLKFMHFQPSDTAWNIVSIWGNNRGVKAKYRFMFENGKEFVCHAELSEGPVLNINLDELIKEHKMPTTVPGVFQLECNGANPHANLLSKHKNEDTMSVDHLTGG